MFKLTPLTIRRLKQFKKNKLAYGSFWILLFVLLLSFFSEWIANDKPYYLYYQGKTYFPLLSEPSAQELGITNRFTIEYRDLELSENDSILFPPVRYNPLESNKKLERYPAPPSVENPLGTDDRGRDVFARLLYGFRISFLYSVGVWILSFLTGVMLGVSMGYFGGKIDFLGQRAVEVISSIPIFFLLIILISIFNPTVKLLVVISALFGWISISYYMRAETLKLRKQEFIEAARALGVSTPKIMFKHILPNALTPIITFSPFVIAAGISSLAALDYLGFGLPPPTPSWGELLNQAKKYFTQAPWLAIFPSLALFSTLTLLNFIGEGLRNAFDPKN